MCMCDICAVNTPSITAQGVQWAGATDSEVNGVWRWTRDTSQISDYFLARKEGVTGGCPAMYIYYLAWRVHSCTDAQHEAFCEWYI